MDVLFTLLGLLFLALLVVWGVWRNRKQTQHQYTQKSAQEDAPPAEEQAKTQLVEHKKKDFLATDNEKKLYFALQKVLSDKYIVHCQIPLISLVAPVDSKYTSRSWAKRVDFVVTDRATKILAVIELDDSSHQNKKRIARDDYVNYALKGNHPLIRINTEKFYDPAKIAVLLEMQAGIKNQLKPATAEIPQE